MAKKGKIHVGDKDTKIILTVNETQANGTNIVFDLQANPTTTIEILVTDPDGVAKTPLTGAIENAPGTDGKVSGTNTSAAYFDQAGPWKFQAKLTLTAGGIFTSNPHVEEVLG